MKRTTLVKGGDSNAKCVPFKSNNSSLFRPGCKLRVHRSSLFGSSSTTTTKTTTTASSSVLHRPFQRPMLKRRAYGSGADAALQTSSLGSKRRLDGMAKLLARAGKGLNYISAAAALTTNKTNNASSDTEDSDDDEDAEKKDIPFEPLEVWKSPHQGGPARGLPPQAYVCLFVCLCVCNCRQNNQTSCCCSLLLTPSNILFIFCLGFYTHIFACMHAIIQYQQRYQ